MRIDHVVLWVADPLRSLDFYAGVLELEPLRVAEFRAGTVPFPSVRVSADAILDLFPLQTAQTLSAAKVAANSTGHRLNHVCLAMGRTAYEALRARLEAHGVAVPVTMTDLFGARGLAREAVYFADPDGNVIEARYYDDGDDHEDEDDHDHG